MAKSKISLAAYRQRNAEIQAMLKSIPPAHSVIILHEPFLKRSHEFETAIKKLKRFLKMLISLAKLNPLKYTQWWQNAYAKPLAKTEELTPIPATVEQTLEKVPAKERSTPVAENKSTPALPPKLYQH